MTARALPWIAGLLLLAACGSPIVGAECASGLTLCDGRCVDLENDPAHCGSCGEDCGRFECRERMCGPNLRPDAGDTDAGPDGGISEDGGASIDSGRPPPGIGRGGVGNPFKPDGGFEFPDDAVVNGCGLGFTDCGGACVDLQSDHANCGECGQACGAEQFCAEGMCVDICEDPLRPCRGACVNFDTDERNCGSCGIVCRSGLCVDGECADVVPGHLVVIGHDFVRLPSPNMQHIANNALFLAPPDQVRTLVYRGEADEASVFGVNDAINRYLKADMSWEQTDVDPDRLSAQLVEAHALLIHAQAGATDAELIELGQRWGLSMTQFLLRGGVIVLFETMSGNNGGGYQLLSPAGLFVADGRVQIPPRRMLWLAEPGDSVAQECTAQYQSQTNTVRFLDVQSVGTTVVEDSDGAPVVIHRVVVP